jgi:hypothetical protein
MGSIKQDIKETYLGLYETVQEKWNDFSQFLKEAWPILAVLLAALLGVWWYADPPPPRHVVMATGQPGGSYDVLGKKYAAFFDKKALLLNYSPQRVPKKMWRTWLIARIQFRLPLYKQAHLILMRLLGLNLLARFHMTQFGFFIVAQRLR